MTNTTVFTDLDVKREAIRQSERHIEAQLKLAVASDQRAVQFCAAVGIAITIAANAGASTVSVAILHIAALIMLTTAALMAAYSCRPVGIHGPGGRAMPVLQFKCDYSGELLDSISFRNDERIIQNDTIIQKNARIFRRAMMVGLIGIALLVLRLWVALAFALSPTA